MVRSSPGQNHLMASIGSRRARRPLVGRSPAQLGPVQHDGSLQGGYVRRRLDPVLGQGGPVAREGAEGFELASITVEGQHELRPSGAYVGLRVDDGRREVGDHAVVVTELQAALEQLLFGAGPKLEQAARSPRLRPVRRRGRQGLAPPQLEGPRRARPPPPGWPGGQELSAPAGPRSKRNTSTISLRPDQPVARGPSSRWRPIRTSGAASRCGSGANRTPSLARARPTPPTRVHRGRDR